MPANAQKRKKQKLRIKQTDPKQSASFLKAAKELGLDETSGEAFERAMDSLTTPKKSSRSN
jgi:hypothetical protein